MSRFIDETDYSHGSPERLGVLMVNLGTPDAPTASAVRRYLREFLWDRRVVEVPRPIWWLILNLIIVPFRSPRSAEAYEQVWTDHGSPLMVHSQAQAEALRDRLARRIRGPFSLELAMRYGRPSIADALERLRRDNVRRLLVLPMYPQYSASTTASVFDAVTAELRERRWVPETRFINQFHDEGGYIAALANSITEHRQRAGRGEHLLMSFHGVPRRYLELGDPYHCQCRKTARLLAERLGLSETEYTVSFQSRLGRAEWLRPYTDETVRRLAFEGVKSLDVICPGFSADCLETLEEIAMQNRDFFTEAGGERFSYIPCLNEREDHIGMLADLVTRHASGWPETDPDWSESRVLAAAEKSMDEAKRLGAER